MKVTGIIAEYNPFHNGHLYQINKIRQETCSDYIIVILSGDFVQRGTPALTDKYTRTKMALACGADLVIELPALWATASAEYFAAAGIALLDKLGIVDHVCFGAECPDIHLLSYLADILLNEPAPYKQELNRLLREGKSFPTARMDALYSYLFHSGNTLFQPEDVLIALATPNNILAIEYIKELKRRDSKIKPYLIQRVGNEYHDKEITPFASAGAIRRLLRPFINRFTTDISLYDTQTNVNPSAKNIGDELLTTMPRAAFSFLQDYCREFPLLDEDAFSSILKYKLLSTAGTGYAHYADANEALSNRIVRNLGQFCSFSGFCEQLKSRDVTHTRLNRLLTHILLDIMQNDYITGRKTDYIPYLRVLGFRKSATQLLGIMKAQSSLPMLTKMADARNVLSGLYPPSAFAHRMLRLDVFAADIYTSVLTDISGNIPKNEYTQGMILF